MIVDIDRLRRDLLNYYGSAMSSGLEMTIINLSEVETASPRRIKEIAEEAGIDLSDYAIEEDIHFITVRVSKDDYWCNKMIKELGLPRDVIIAAIQRQKKTIVPRGEVVIKEKDQIIICAMAMKDDKPVNIQEIILRKNHPWNGMAIKNLSISRQSFIIMIKRHNRMMLPNGNIILTEGDEIILYSSGDES